MQFLLSIAIVLFCHHATAADDGGDKAAADCKFPCLDINKSYTSADNVVWLRVEDVKTTEKGNLTAKVTSICQHKDGFTSSELLVTSEERALLGAVGSLKNGQQYIVFVKRGSSGEYRLVTAPLPGEQQIWYDIFYCSSVQRLPRFFNPIVSGSKLNLANIDSTVYAGWCMENLSEKDEAKCPRLPQSVCFGANDKWTEIFEEVSKHNDRKTARPLLVWGSLVRTSPVDDKAPKSSKESVILQPKCQFQDENGGLLPSKDEVSSKPIEIEIDTSKCFEFPSNTSILGKLLQDGKSMNSKQQPNNNYLMVIRRAQVEDEKANFDLERIPLKLGESEMKKVARCCLLVSVSTSLECPVSDEVIQEEDAKTCDCNQLISSLIAGKSKPEIGKIGKNPKLLAAASELKQPEKQPSSNDTMKGPNHYLVAVLIIIGIAFIGGIVIGAIVMAYRRAKLRNSPLSLSIETPSTDDASSASERQHVASPPAGFVAPVNNQNTYTRLVEDE